MSKSKVLPPISSVDILKSAYSELSASRQPYLKSVIIKDNTEDQIETYTDENHRIKKHKELRRSQKVRDFEEFTCGSLYAPVSTLGYKSFDYEWALCFKVDCDLAREKTGSIEDAMVHYISDLASNSKIIKRRSVLNSYRGGRIRKTNSEDINERYLKRMKRLTPDEKKEIKEWLKKNKEILDASQDSFQHEDYKSSVSAFSVSITAGPEESTDEEFLSWLVNSNAGSRRVIKKPQLDSDDADDL